MIERLSVTGEVSILEDLHGRNPSELRDLADTLEINYKDGVVAVKYSYDSTDVIFLYQRPETDAEYKLRLESIEEADRRKEKKLKKDRREFERLKKLFEGETL